MTGRPLRLRALNLDCSVEHKLGRTGKRNAAKLLIDLFKPNTQFVSPARENADRTFHVFRSGKDKRARDDPGATREGFIFHTSFVGADGDLIRSAFFNEIHVCALWRKHFVIANRWAF